MLTPGDSGTLINVSQLASTVFSESSTLSTSTSLGDCLTACREQAVRLTITIMSHFNIGIMSMRGVNNPNKTSEISFFFII